MGVATAVQPDSTTQTGTAYKGAIDASTSVVKKIGDQFSVHQQSTANLTVRIEGGILLTPAGGYAAVAAASTSSLTAPTVNPRKDIVYFSYHTAGFVVATGAEAGSPVDPTIPLDALPLARINWTVGMTSIDNSKIDDLRPSHAANDPGFSRIHGCISTNNSTTPLTKWDLNAAAVVLRNPTTGFVTTRVTPGAITCDIGVSGPAANGRDTSGALADGWIYFYWIWNPTTRTLATTASVTAPPTGPALPSGYTEWAFDSAVRKNSGSLVRTYYAGSYGYFRDRQLANSGGTTTGSGTAISLSTLTPPNAMEVDVSSELIATADGSGFWTWIVSLGVVTFGSAFWNGNPALTTSASNQLTLALAKVKMPIVAAQIFYLLQTIAGSSPVYNVYVHGFKIPNGGE